jgi:hypothetical protein
MLPQVRPYSLSKVPNGLLNEIVSGSLTIPG